MSDQRPKITKTAWLYAAGIFASASLLFMVQPMVAKLLLPRLGGTAAVWTTCMLFFQLLLLGGYLYAHILAKRLPPKLQLGLHLALIAACALFLPISIRDGAPSGDGMPIGWLLITLLGAVGLPFFVLSTTSPLLQSWFARTKDPLSHNPYPLYAASNIGSMASLLGYPLLVEPSLTLWHQTAAWAAGFATFAALLLGAAAVFKSSGGMEVVDEDEHGTHEEPAPSPKEIARWIGLSALPSSLLLGVTTHITTDVAPMPMLWILPLALYLATFIIVFARWDHEHQRRAEQLSAALIVPALGFLLIKPGLSALALLLFYILTFTSLTLTLHGRLALSRPAAAHLTLFFLCMSIGGAAGGLFNGLFAPIFFDKFYELFIALWIAALALSGVGVELASGSKKARAALGVAAMLIFVVTLNLTINKDGQLEFIGASVLMGLIVVALLDRLPRTTWGLLVTALLAIWVTRGNTGATIHWERSFFSTHEIREDRAKNLRYIAHGTTFHGTQSRDPALRQQALSYHHPAGPAGQALRRLQGEGSKIAVLGLGAGVLAAYCRGGAQCDFFEIDPVVVDLARKYFTFLEDCGESCAVEIGDGRLLIEAKSKASYDIIFLDAYSSDSVPVHLVTKEAVEIYKERLKPGGALIFNISNRYIDLRPVLAMLAQHTGQHAAFQVYYAPPEVLATHGNNCAWVVMAPDEATIARLLADPAWTRLVAKEGEPLWTDDFSNLLPVISNGGPARPR